MIWNPLVQHAQAWVANNAWRAVAAVLLLAAGWFLAAVIRRALRALLRRRAGQRKPWQSFATVAFRIDLVWLGIIVASFALALAALGVATEVIGLIVTVGLGVGFIADAFSGLRLLGSRFYRIGDLIEIRNEAKDEGFAGVVIEISAGRTVLETHEGTQVIVPNRKLLDHLIVNYSSSGTRLLRLQFVLDSRPGIDMLEERLRSLAGGLVPKESGRDGQAQVVVTQIDADTVTFVMHSRVSPYDVVQTASDFLRRSKAELERAGVGVRSIAILPN